MNEKLIAALGFVSKTHHYLYGQRLLEQLPTKKVFLVLITSDMGPTSQKKLNDKAYSANVKTLVLPLTTDQLTTILHHETPIAAIGIIDANLAKLVQTTL